MNTLKVRLARAVLRGTFWESSECKDYNWSLVIYIEPSHYGNCHLCKPRVYDVARAAGPRAHVAGCTVILGPKGPCRNAVYT